MYAKYFPCIESYQSDLDRICLKRNGYHNGVYKQRFKISKSPIRAGTDKIKRLNTNALTYSKSLAPTFRDIALQNLCDAMKASVLNGGKLAGMFLFDLSSCTDLGAFLRHWLQNFETNQPQVYDNIKNTMRKLDFN